MGVYVKQFFPPNSWCFFKSLSDIQLTKRILKGRISSHQPEFFADVFVGRISGSRKNYRHFSLFSDHSGNEKHSNSSFVHLLIQICIWSKLWFMTSPENWENWEDSLLEVNFTPPKRLNYMYSSFPASASCPRIMNRQLLFSGPVWIVEWLSHRSWIFPKTLCVSVRCMF